MADIVNVESVIVRPEDPSLIERLRAKLEEYTMRADPGGYAHPGRQLLDNPDAFLKRRFLQTVLDEGRADGEIIGGQLLEEFPDDESRQIIADHFSNSWGVIWDYCTNAGVHTFKNDRPGTGLDENTTPIPAIPASAVE